MSTSFKIRARYFRMNLLSSQDLVNALEASTLEAQGDRDPQELIGIRLDEMVERGGPQAGAGRLARLSTEGL